MHLLRFLLLLFLFGFLTSAGAQVRMKGESDALILESFLKHARAAPAVVSADRVRRIEMPEDITWTWAPVLRMPLAAYHLTKDASFLAVFVEGMDNLIAALVCAPDGYLGFSGLPFPLFRPKEGPAPVINVDVADFAVAELICAFAEDVAADTHLALQFGTKAREYLALAENHLAGRKWDRRGRYVDLGRTGAVMRMASECGNNRNDLTHPHNKQAKFCATYLLLFHTTGNDEWFRRAVKIGTRFKRTLKLAGDRYVWNYWDPAGEWDRKPDGSWKHWIGPEEAGSYLSLTVGMAVSLYDHGVVFDRSDIQRFVNTQMKVCWNGSLDVPVFRTVAGTDAGRPPMIAAPLARFEPKVWDFCCGESATAARLNARNHSWQGGPVAEIYLSLKYLTERSPEPAQIAYRDRFLRVPENRRFLEELAYEVPRVPEDP